MRAFGEGEDGRTDAGEVDMGSLRDALHPSGAAAPRDLAEHLTSRGLFRVAAQSVPLSDRVTVH
jgi:hypothetical protein